MSTMPPKPQSGRGRPTTHPKDTYLAVRVDEITLARLDNYCQNREITRSQGVRDAIRLLAETENNKK